MAQRYDSEDDSEAIGEISEKLLSISQAEALRKSLGGKNDSIVA